MYNRLGKESNRNKSIMEEGAVVSKTVSNDSDVKSISSGGEDTKVIKSVGSSGSTVNDNIGIETTIFNSSSRATPTPTSPVVATKSKSISNKCGSSIKEAAAAAGKKNSDVLGKDNNSPDEANSLSPISAVDAREDTGSYAISTKGDNSSEVATATASPASYTFGASAGNGFFGVSDSGTRVKSTPSSLRRSLQTVTVKGNNRSQDLYENDVVCEKGRGDHERWPGNKLYRQLINLNKETYNNLAPIERSNIIGKIISAIQDKEGWFVSHSEGTGSWTRLTEEKVRKKVSDDLRREVRRRREKRTPSNGFSTKSKQLHKESSSMSSSVAHNDILMGSTVSTRDILERVDEPRRTDVMFGPGSKLHEGNRLYWDLMRTNMDQLHHSHHGSMMGYGNSTAQQRSEISRSIVHTIRNQHGFRFLEYDSKTGYWYSINDRRAIEKTGCELFGMRYGGGNDVFSSPQSTPHHHHNVGARGMYYGMQQQQQQPHHGGLTPHHHYHQAMGMGGAGNGSAYTNHLSYRLGPPTSTSVTATTPSYDTMYHHGAGTAATPEDTADGFDASVSPKRSKKFRLLNRMVDEDDHRTPTLNMNGVVDGSSNNGIVHDEDGTIRTEHHTNQEDEVGNSNNTKSLMLNNSNGLSNQTISPIPNAGGMNKEGGKIISPSSGSEVEEGVVEYQEQSNPNNSHLHHQIPHPNSADGGYGSSPYQNSGGAGAAADIIPRISHYSPTGHGSVGDYHSDYHHGQYHYNSHHQQQQPQMMPRYNLGTANGGMMASSEQQPSPAVINYQLGGPPGGSGQHIPGVPARMMKQQEQQYLAGAPGGTGGYWMGGNSAGSHDWSPHHHHSESYY